VTLNGAPLGIERLGFAVAVIPGKVTVQVRPPEGEPVVREASIGPAESQTITISLLKRPEPVVIVAPPPPPPPPRFAPPPPRPPAPPSLGRRAPRAAPVPGRRRAR